MNTQFAVVAAGKSPGLPLGYFLRVVEGINCVVLERQSPDLVLGRVRAGVVEQITVSLMERLGLDARLRAEGLVEAGLISPMASD